YPLLVQAQGYQEFQTMLQVVAGVNPPQMVKLVPLVSAVTIVSDPSGASVLINGFVRGVTPLSLELESGTYEVALQMENFRPKFETIVLLPGENKTVSLVMESLLGYLHVTEPEGISIYVDGSFRGWAPNTITLPEGSYLVTLKDKGRETFRQQVQILAGQTTELPSGDGM
ncbi:MAG TPA: PEGA domain-containing protein, partial [Thermotogota bacterium]|nr:PEGA domain-containing protein [Thermotogota bacterium]